MGEQEGYLYKAETLSQIEWGISSGSCLLACCRAGGSASVTSGCAVRGTTGQSTTPGHAMMQSQATESAMIILTETPAE